MATDDRAREDLAHAIHFALKHKVLYLETRKAIRSLPEGHLDAMAREIADYLIVCRWRHVAPPIGSHMDGLKVRRDREPSKD